ncbi:hypothetical protein ACKUB1_09745 [Methanospirillum stamsii]|uniref:Uncharacterized protein n=1 Tax=Methanospirillum stamsii TaxID=1277351 RepID=A0A2V2NG26_9EURY|nr:hypothetical protein [Methanospirillum stamsii]PWR75347.1 hypothetical protein DLD82_04220 [Methanospirillum stamsii]
MTTADVITEAAIMAVVRDWYNQKPDGSRIISRKNIESYLGFSRTRGPERKSISMKISRICDAHFEVYSPSSRTRAWVVSPEVIA